MSVLNICLNVLLGSGALVWLRLAACVFLMSISFGHVVQILTLAERGTAGRILGEILLIYSSTPKKTQ